MKRSRLPPTADGAMLAAIAIAIAIALTLGGAVAQETPAVGATDAPVVQAMEVVTVLDCPILDARDWRAWVERGDDGGRVLRIEGDVDLPTPGYTIAWREGPADRRLPPAQAFVLEAAAPEGMAIQMISTETLAYRGPATYSAYRALRIMCGETMIAEIEDVSEKE